MESIEQVAIAPLMSYLIGAPIPLNSIVNRVFGWFKVHFLMKNLCFKGKIPLRFLNISNEEKSLAYKQNCLQIIQQLKVNHIEY